MFNEYVRQGEPEQAVIGLQKVDSEAFQKHS